MNPDTPNNKSQPFENQKHLFASNESAVRIVKRWFLITYYPVEIADIGLV